MNCRVLVAGWPFAGLLALSARRLDPESSATCRSGVVTENDGRRGSLVIEPGDVAGLIEIDEITTALYGVDGYPISLADLRVGDLVEAVQEKRGPGVITTEIRVMWGLSASGSTAI
jgi:hypothetical protein